MPGMKSLSYLCLALAAFSVRAQEKSDYLDLSLEELLNVTVTVVSKYEQTLADAPAVVSVLSREQIMALGVDTLSELINYVPGWYVALDSNAATQFPVITARGQHQAQVLILIDGEPINDQTNSSPLVMNKFIDLHNVQRVEVMRGPGSYLYGTSAFVGTINLVTRDAADEVVAEAGSNDARRLVFAKSYRSPTGYLALYGHYYRDAGERYSGLFDRWDLTDSSRDPRRHLTLQLKGGVGDVSFSLYHNNFRMEDFYQFGLLGNGDNYEEFGFTSANLYWQPQALRSVEGRFRVGLRRYTADAVAQSLPGGQPPLTGGDFLIGPYAVQDAASAEARFLKVLHNGHYLLWGATWERATLPRAYAQATYDIFSPAFTYLGGTTVLDYSDELRFIPDVARVIKGLYVQYQADWADWGLAVGGRYDDFSDVGSSVSPNAALIYRPAPGQRLKATYGEAFRAPALNQLYSQNNPETVGAPLLDPEEIRTVNLEYLLQRGGSSLSATLFWNDADHLIQRVRTSLSDGSTSNAYYNVGRQRVVGLELAWDQPLLRDWRLRTSYAELLDNDFASSRPLAEASPIDFVADRYGSLALDYRRDLWHANLNAYVRDAVDVLPGQGVVGVLNGTLDYRLRPDTRLYLQGNNLLNADYDSPSIGAGLGTDATGQIVRATPNRGRGVYVGVAYNLD